MRRSAIRELILTAALSLTMSVSLSYGAVLAIDHLLGVPDEPEIVAVPTITVDSD